MVSSRSGSPPSCSDTQPIDREQRAYILVWELLLGHAKRDGRKPSLDLAVAGCYPPLVPDTTVPHTPSVMPVQSLRVEVVKGPDRGRHFLATSDTISVGTADGNDLVLTDDTVSRY